MGPPEKKERPGKGAQTGSDYAESNGFRVVRQARTVLPAWVRLTKRYLAGDVRAGYRANASITRWRKRHFR